MTATRVFLSGGFRSNWQEKVILACGPHFTFLNPREHGLLKHDEYTTWNVHHIKQADIVFAYLEKENPSGLGLIFEVGVAHGLNKTIILVDEKSRQDELFQKYFQIVRKSSNNVFDNLQEGILFLKSFG